MAGFFRVFDVTPSDEFFDLVFVVTLAHIGVKFRVDEDWSSLVSLFAHWIPMYYNWFVFESFLNRFSALVKWVYILYLGAFIGVIGVAVNVERCGLSTFTLADVPYRCFDFALFIFCGRVVVVLAWLMAALGVSSGKAYCWWRVIAGLVPGECACERVGDCADHSSSGLLLCLHVDHESVAHHASALVCGHRPRHYSARGALHRRLAV